MLKHLPIYDRLNIFPDGAKEIVRYVLRLCWMQAISGAATYYGAYVEGMVEMVRVGPAFSLRFSLHIHVG